MASILLILLVSLIGVLILCVLNLLEDHLRVCCMALSGVCSFLVRAASRLMIVIVVNVKANWF